MSVELVSASDLALFDPMPTSTTGPLVDAGALVGPQVLAQAVLRPGRRHPLELTMTCSAVTLMTSPAWRAISTWPESTAAWRFDAGADDRRLRPQQRHGLALHVRAHERAVGVVVLEERDQGGRHRDDLLGGHVHELDLLRARLRELVPVPCRHALVDEVAFLVQRGVCLRDVPILLVVGGEEDDLVGDRGRIGNAVAFCFFSSTTDSGVNRSPLRRTTTPPFVATSASAVSRRISGSSHPTVRLTFR